jgi:hypothetical protein
MKKCFSTFTVNQVQIIANVQNVFDVSLDDIKPLDMYRRLLGELGKNELFYSPGTPRSLYIGLIYNF